MFSNKMEKFLEICFSSWEPGLHSKKHENTNFNFENLVLRNWSPFLRTPVSY